MSSGKKLVGALVVETEATLPIMVVRLPMFDKVADKLFTPEETADLEYAVASCRHLGRELGVVIKGTGGVRKMRWQLDENNKGKRGGARIWYYHGGDHMPVFLVAAYPKSKKENLSAAEKKLIRARIQELDKEWEKYRDDEE